LKVAVCDRRSHEASFFFLLLVFSLVILTTHAKSQVQTIAIQSPLLSKTTTTNLLSPVHVQATAEDTAEITGYVVYLDGNNVYRNFSTAVDAWIMIPPGHHTFYVKVWDAHTNLKTFTYQINISGFAPPTPPLVAHRINNIDNGTYTVDNNPNVGGACNHGSISSFASRADPNTMNLPASDHRGQHFVLASGCQYDDSLFYRKFNTNPLQYVGDTNFLWDFWFYMPTTTRPETMQALEADLFQTVPMVNGVHEFMFGSQCNYATNQWQIWLPKGAGLGWVNAGLSPCRFTTGQWHHVTYFLQRVTPGGYQEVPQAFGPTTDTNTSLRFGTLTIDDKTMYLGGVSWSTIPKPAWNTVLGVQHQLDSSVAGALIEEYLDKESLTAW
jgi:hypothetical protein